MIKQIIKKIIGVVCLFFPLDRKKILVSSYVGRGYGDNPKYIVKELLKRNLGYKIIWIVKNEEESKTLPDGVTPCLDGTIMKTFHATTAKVWIDNCRKQFLYKRKHQYYIQVWHGDIGLKKVEKDVEDKLGKEYVRWAKKDSENANLMISGAKWYTEVIKRAFWYDGEILECGYPRRDIFYKKDPKFIENIKKKINVDQDTKIIFYAPTFRNYHMGKEISFSCYDIDWKNIISAMEEKFGGKWVGMIRLHPNIAKYSHMLSIPSDVKDVTFYPDMQELMLVSDCMITDYSSSLLEFGVIGKCGFIFANDYDEYKKDRDTYFDLKHLPFPFAENNEILIDCIKNFDEKKYNSDMNYFYNEVLGVCDKGNASEQIVDRIISVTK